MKTITNLSAYSKTDSFLYSLLDRLKQDCEYYLGNGNRGSKYLWALDESEHINEMKAIYNHLEVKPNWLTLQEIENFEQRFNLTGKSNECRQVLQMLDEDVYFGRAVRIALLNSTKTKEELEEELNLYV